MDRWLGLDILKGRFYVGWSGKKPTHDNLKFWCQFNRRHRNPVEPVIRWFYGLYLRSNQPPQGLFSYDAATAFVIAYYRKFGEV